MWHTMDFLLIYNSFKKLGYDFYGNNIDIFSINFTEDHNLEVNIMFDAGHMIKLVKSTLADKYIFKPQNGIIKCMYLYYSVLNDIQNDIGFKFANKLTSQPINYSNSINSIMKVKLAAQILNSVVANAI